ncbi:hypothetical protein EJ06DRAFT_571662 [Trichodelitschia bisporula]|uniref:FAD-binding FR-type domain-containing protein n=1 Tax=Trichodelitschia bisporula TaxID=703511 RepID=A0A6G1I5A8_9PEZI|nr:hypothetical protein EJ06DRAFT_571662 [Trichodelitschia bisporula]
MAFACIPILVALSGKANIITLLTGVSHERLNVLHRWVAWMSFGLSLVHTIPFFYASIYDEGDGGDQRVKSEFYTNKMRGANEYSGVPPLAMLFGLCILSLPPLRNKFYESFYAVHILLAITYLGLLFWHAANVNDSWAYLWATLAVWLASWAARTFYYTRPLNIHSAWFVPSQATLVPLPGAVTRIEVWPPEDFAHSPAQHVFLRFTALAPLDNHPFTIVSAPMDSGSQPSPLVFLARTHAGFTARLARYALANVNGKDEAASTPVWIDGPYGGVSRSFETRYDTLVLLAGGTGISACLPWMLSAREGRLKRVVLVWAVRRAEALAWVTGELEAVGKGEVEVVVQMHITGEVEEGKDGKEVGEGLGKEARVEVAGSEGKSGFAERLAALGPSLEGRPVMSEVLSKHVRAGERTMVFACGPEGFRVDVANAVAGAQRRVLSGECVEIGMHIETFGW